MIIWTIRNTPHLDIFSITLIQSQLPKNWRLHSKVSNPTKPQGRMVLSLNSQRMMLTHWSTNSTWLSCPVGLLCLSPGSGVMHKMITFLKDKDNRSDGNSYLFPSLASPAIESSCTCCQLLNCLANRVMPDSQSGFRAVRSTINMVFALHHLQKKAVGQNQPLVPPSLT